MAVEFAFSGARPGLHRVRRLLRRLLRRYEVSVPALVKEHVDTKFYCDRYPDVRKSGIDPVVHYYRWGAAEGRNPTRYFDTRAYEAEAGDRIPAGMNPFLHFLQTVGPPEAGNQARTFISRAELQAMLRLFDLNFYIEYNGLHGHGLKSAYAGLMHYVDQGWTEGFDPSPGFSTKTYLRANPDVALNNINPLLHYVSTGRGEGREPLPLRYLPAGSLDVQAEIGRVLRDSPRAPAALETRDDVTVVVPVFNAPDDVADLLQSLAASVGPQQRIVLVDDASTDPSVEPILADFAADRPGTRLVRHRENRGFAAGVNAGIAAAPGNHVVVLNSDLVLPPGWLSRLLAPIDKSPETVASVTPFSNTSSLTGFPDSAHEGPLYKDCSLAELDAVFRRMPPCSIDLPSACGFCMALGAAALDAVGGFDSDAYGRGYFEETDWCQRALAAGYRHLVAVDLFVEHKPGSASFSVEERITLSDRNRTVFDRRNPDYREQRRLFRHADPLSDIRDLARILVWTSAAVGKRLLLTHRWGGGVSDYIGRERRQLLDSGHLVVTLDVQGREARVVIEYQDEQLELTAGPQAALEYLLGFGFDEIEFHALHGADGLPVLLPYLGQKLAGHRYSVFFHDFLPLCPTIHLVDDHGRFCRIPSPQRCLECLHRNVEVRYPVANITSWRAMWWPLLENAARLVIMDASAAEYIKAAFPAVASERFEIVPPRYAPNLPAVQRFRTGFTVNVAVVGRMTLHKGAEVIEDLMTHLDETGANVSVTLFGEWHHHGLPPAGLRVRGSYRPDQLPQLIADRRIHVALFPSVCPETYSFTLSELFAMELPVVAFDLGAQGRRVGAYRKGMVCPEGIEPQQLLAALRKAAAL